MIVKEKKVWVREQPEVACARTPAPIDLYSSIGYNNRMAML
jgi:hypothetical protein